MSNIREFFGKSVIFKANEGLLFLKGNLVDVTEKAADIGIVYPVFVTRQLHELVVTPSKAAQQIGETADSRMTALLNVFSWGVCRNPNGPDFEQLFDFYSTVNTRHQQDLRTVKAICSKGSNGKPAYFLMLSYQV